MTSISIICILASGSALKLKACSGVVAGVTFEPCGEIKGGDKQQPIGIDDAWSNVLSRITQARQLHSTHTGPILAIENFITDDLTQDRALLVLDYPLRRFSHLSEAADVPVEFRPDLCDVTRFDVTVGRRIHDKHPEIPHDDWFHHFPGSYMTRHRQISDAVLHLFHRVQALQCDHYRTTLQVFPNYPKPGVQFHDLWSIFAQQPSVADAMVTNMANQIRARRIPGRVVICGLEMRGVMLGAMVARDLGLAFIPIRKHGAKLPGPCQLSAEYGTEYSKDQFKMQLTYLNKTVEPRTIADMNGVTMTEMTASLVPQFDSAIVIDDIIATGGSMVVACELLESKEVGGLKVSLILAIKDVEELRSEWMDKLTPRWPVALVWD